MHRSSEVVTQQACHDMAVIWSAHQNSGLKYCYVCGEYRVLNQETLVIVSCWTQISGSIFQQVKGLKRQGRKVCKGRNPRILRNQVKVHERVMPLCEDGALGRYQDIENNSWKCQGQGEGGQVGEGIDPFFHIIDRCERNTDEQRCILQNRFCDIIAGKMSNQLVNSER